MSNPDGGLTFCPHQFHCRECEARVQHIVRSWQAKVAELERELARLRTHENGG